MDTGLQKYMAKRSLRFLENYKLHDEYLVIDGSIIANHLFYRYARYNSLFCGDYQIYAQCVSNFIDQLVQCRIKPLILFDGGYQNTKLETIISHIKQKIKRASQLSTSFQSVNQYSPLLLENVFKDVLNKRGIKYTQCIFEAVHNIVAIARILNCPILSYNPDFYIYGSLYVPFNTLGNSVFITNDICFKYCKIYRVKTFLEFHNGLELASLPLAAMLIGNNYTSRHIKQCTFEKFFHDLNLLEVEGCDKEDLRIHAIWNWLKQRSVDQAIEEILNKICMEERRHILRIIKTIIKNYIDDVDIALSLIAPILDGLGVKENIQNMSRTDKFEGNISNFSLTIEKILDTLEITDDETTEKQEIEAVLHEDDLISDETRVNNMPEWFINEFKLGRYSGYLIDIIIRRLYICDTQIEDYSRVSFITASLKIISVICKLLISEVEENNTNISYITRGDNDQIKRYQLTYSNEIHGCKLPIISDLRELPISCRQTILNATLDISELHEKCLNDIPSSWKLYLVTMKYWLYQQQEPLKCNYYIYSLLFAILFNIIAQKIECYKSLDILYEQKRYQRRYSMDVTLSKAIDEVDEYDCLLVSAFFLSHFEVDPKLHVEPEKFDITIVHAFMQFQGCLSHSMSLNALLEYPYEQTKVGDVFNGTLLYNLCIDFKSCSDIKAYINVILRNSPSLSRLFKLLLTTTESLFFIVLQN